MRIKEFLLCDSSRDFLQRFEKGIIIELSGNIIHNFSDDETNLVCNLIVKGYKAGKENINITKDTNDDVTSETAHIKAVGFLDNFFEVKKCLFLSSDKFDEDGGAIVYLNLNREECIQILKTLKEIRNRIYKTDLKNRIKALLS